jgi:uncharacterized protein YcnI
VVRLVKRRRSLLLGAAAAALVAAPAALGHGTLTPTTAAAGGSQRFELVVPNDRPDADIVGVTLRLPAGVRLETAEAEQPRWAVSSTDDTVVWRGGPIDRGSSQAFSFTARMPSRPGSVELALVESYDDGDGAPFAITVSVTGVAVHDGGSGSTLAAIALAVALLALGVATTALLVALRRRSSPP